MPSTATITAFYSFVANTKARATQVNNNFDVFRGHILPVSAVTQTASDGLYDLGSNEYRWRNLYTTGLDSTAGASYDFKINGSTIGSIKALGYQGLSYNARGQTTTAAREQFAVSAGFSFSVTGAATSAITGTTLTISTIGRPVIVGLMNDNSTSLGQLNMVNSSTNTASRFDWSLMRNGTTVSVYSITRNGNSGAPINDAPWTIKFIDLAPTLSSAVYHIGVNAFNTSDRLVITNLRAYAYEMT